MTDPCPDLAAEYMAALALAKTPAYARRLAQLGMNGITRRCCGAAGVSGVVWRSYRLGCDLYEPAHEGAELLAVILPVWGRGLADLVAWDVRGGRMGSRMGVAFALGETALIQGDKVMVFSDPEAWWRAFQPPPIALMPDPVVDVDLTSGHWPYSPLGREYFSPPGIVIVDWSDVWHQLSRVARVVGDCEALAERLDKALRPPKQVRPSIGMLAVAAETVAA